MVYIALLGPRGSSLDLRAVDVVSNFYNEMMLFKDFAGKWADLEAVSYHDEPDVWYLSHKPSLDLKAFMFTPDKEDFLRPKLLIEAVDPRYSFVPQAYLYDLMGKDEVVCFGSISKPSDN